MVRRKRKADPKQSTRRAKARRLPRLCDGADKYDLYQRSVQTPDNEVRMLRRFYKDAYGAAPKVLREDFCGTAAVATEWVRRHKDGIAYGVDLDPEPLAWGTEHNLAKLGPSAKKRITLVRGDVRDDNTPPADVVAAQNFSFYVFKTRDELREYFAAAHRHLKRKGVLALDMLGGPSVYQDEEEEEKRVDDEFTYYWEEERFNPITHEALFHIHFGFDDGSLLKKAFTYDWRMWNIPEVREVLAEAGFSRSVVYWEGSDAEGEGSGVFRRTEKAPADLCWLAYVVAMK